MNQQVGKKLQWTEEAVELLEQLVARGRTSANMAYELSLRFGTVTRNAVIGKCSRMGLQLTSRTFGLATSEAAKQAASKGTIGSGAAVSRPPTPATDGDRAGANTGPVANHFTDAPAACAPQPTQASGNGEGGLVHTLPVDPDLGLMFEDAYNPLDFEIPPEAYFGPTRFIEARSNQCKWFMTDSSAYDAPVCGEQHVVGLAYCPTHAKRVYTAAPRPNGSAKFLEAMRKRRAGAMKIYA